MADHTEQLVGALFRILAEEGHADAQQALLRTYQTEATADRDALAADLFSELLDVLHEEVDDDAEIDMLTAAVERLLDRFSAVVEASPVAMVVVDTDGTVRLWNDGAERIFGWNDTEIRGRTYHETLADAPEEGEAFLSRLRDDEPLRGIETRHHTKDGGPIEVRVWAAPIHRADGGYGGGAFVISDITEQKQREQRLAVLNRVLRHNIRNDVTVIEGRLEMLAETHGLESDHLRVVEDRLSNIVSLSDAARHVEQLRDPTEAECATVDLGTVLHERVARLRGEFPDADVTVDVPESVSVVGHELLPYAFDNVLDNALEHNDAATPRLVVRVTTSSDASPEHVVVHVADDGPGLPATERRVLTAETESPLSHSSGMGLWLTRWIVRSSGGSLAVAESEWNGTCVTIRLPGPSGSA